MELPTIKFKKLLIFQELPSPKNQNFLYFFKKSYKFFLKHFRIILFIFSIN